MALTRKSAVKSKSTAKKQPAPAAKKAAPIAKKAAPPKKNPVSAVKKAPDFNLPALKGNVSLKQLKGRKVVLYFYPKDDTSGCTAQACGFQDNMPQFKKAGVEVIGVSKDDLKSHQKFAKKYKLGFNLASDEKLATAKAFGTWVEKSMYGRKYMGMDRATFLINEKGEVVQEWRSVKVPGHVEEVLKKAKSL